METVVSFTEVGNPQKVKIEKPVKEVEQADVEAAVAQLVSTVSGHTHGAPR